MSRKSISKIEQFKNDPVFSSLSLFNKDFIRKKSIEFSFSFQELKQIIDIAADLEMWQEGIISGIWSEDKTEKLKGKNLRQKLLSSITLKWESLKNKSTNYSNYNPISTPVPKLEFIKQKNDSIILGNCPVASEKTRCCNLYTLDAVKNNQLDSAYIRPMCFYGSEGMGLRADNLKVHVMIAAWEWGAYFGTEELEKGIRIRTSSYTRHHVNITMCKAKANGNYMNSMLALQEALSCGYDEAMLLDNEGYVAEGSGENIFLVRDGVIYTPTLTSALDGITRATIVQLADELGISVIEKQITRDEVYVADEVFFTGTAAEVTPIREVDNRQIADGNRGPITEKLQTLYFDIVHGRVPEKTHWLSYTN
ncbi:MAG: branched-chain amino acid transaminase [Spirochaetales bacterium]|nr:branched-chain amino acid transaminase [Spirochaetales bacterium]